MRYLLFPGRHLVNTRFQEDYLKRLLSIKPSKLPGLITGSCQLNGPPTEIIFAITSANQENSRFNPIPFHVRAIGVDRFAGSLRQRVPFRFRVVGIPHYGHTQNFAEFTVKEIANQSEQAIKLIPENCLVLCSTPEVIRRYQALGFAIAPAEAAEPDPKPVTPIEIIREIGSSGAEWAKAPLVKANLAASHWSLFEDLPEVPQRIVRLYQDPLTKQEGGLTETRNYSSYVRGMNEIIRIKYLDIRDGIQAGRIVDEGCADGALLAEISRDFPDSDLFGIDLSAEFAGRFHERQRTGEFGGAYVHFFHRNLFDPIFERESINTTLCNSTLHEIWSYGEGEKSVRNYLGESFANFAGEATCSFGMWSARRIETWQYLYGVPTQMAGISQPKSLRSIADAKLTGSADFPPAVVFVCSRRIFWVDAALFRASKQFTMVGLCFASRFGRPQSFYPRRIMPTTGLPK